MATRDTCDCGMTFSKHAGVVDACRKHRETQEALIRLLSASEQAVAGLTNEFGYSGVKANFEPLLDAIDRAKQTLARS